MLSVGRVGAIYVYDKLKKPLINVEGEEPVQGKIVVITGANSGIGAVTALEMAMRKAIVVMACRDMKKGQTVMDDIKAKVPGAQLDLVALDLGHFDSVRNCANAIRERYSHINILINNAGIFFLEKKIYTNKEGLEAHMATNHLGHFLLTLLLLDHLKAATRSRVVFTSSSVHQLAKLDMEDLMLEKRGYFGFQHSGAYCNSKLANMYCVKEFAKRLDSSFGVRFYALCPGFVKTDVFRGASGIAKFLTSMGLALFGMTPQEGAETIIYCALSKNCADDSGKMYHFNKEWKGVMDKLDHKVSHQLWEKSEELVALSLQAVSSTPASSQL